MWQGTVSSWLAPRRDFSGREHIPAEVGTRLEVEHLRS